MVPLFANVLGELWGWVTGVFGRVGDVSIYWLLLALALKTAESALIALGWRDEHPWCVRCGSDLGNGRPGALLHRCQRADGDRGSDLPAEDGLQGVALGRGGRLAR